MDIEQPGASLQTIRPPHTANWHMHCRGPLAPPDGDDSLLGVEFGVERASQLLVARLIDQNDARIIDFAMQWPYDLGKSELSEEDSIVAANSNNRGDLPTFIEHADGSLTPLPRDPRHPHDGWNFGYGGGGPGMLASAITRVVAALDGQAAAENATHGSTIKSATANVTT